MKLLLLRCPQCNHTLTPGNEDVVVQCSNCRSAVSINEGGLSLLPANFAAPTQRQAEAWLPFWVYRGQVTLKSRETQGGRSAEKDARAFWEQPRQVYIPAWGAELAQARDLMRKLLEKQPSLQAQPTSGGAAFAPAVLSPDDGRKLLELVIVSIEASRSDWLESLDFDLRLDSEALWLLPAEQDNDGWRLLIRGV